MADREPTHEEIASIVAKNNAQARQADAETEFFKAHALGAGFAAKEQEISLHAKQRVERAVLAQNEYHHRYIFDQAVNDKSVKACVRQMTTWSRQSTADGEKPCDIELQINSPGGSIFDGFALIDFMRDLSRQGHKITAVTYGMAASMGGVILQAADHRAMGENSFLLLHEGSLFAAGDFGHVEDEYRLMQLLHERILALFCARSKVSASFIKRNWKRKDWWLDAQTALRHGFVDEIRK